VVHGHLLPPALPAVNTSSRHRLTPPARSGRSGAADKRQEQRMIVTTTDFVEGRTVRQYLGVVAGEAVIGANIFRDLFAGIRDVVGGRSGSYEDTLRQARIAAIDELMGEARKLGADAVVGVSVDFEGGLQNGSMMMVCAAGTAVKLS
jgi:uncharacterized protein YbjQ (UPF0145 family)